MDIQQKTSKFEEQSKLIAKKCILIDNLKESAALNEAARITKNDSLLAKKQREIEVLRVAGANALKDLTEHYHAKNQVDTSRISTLEKSLSGTANVASIIDTLRENIKREIAKQNGDQSLQQTNSLTNLKSGLVSLEDISKKLAEATSKNSSDASEHLKSLTEAERKILIDTQHKEMLLLKKSNLEGSLEAEKLKVLQMLVVCKI